MTLQSKPNRREALLTGAAFAGFSGLPVILKAQTASVRIGLVHPVTGFAAYSGNQCREGALMAIADINAAGGIKSLGGAKIEAVLADSQSKPEIGAAEVEKLVEAGVHGVVAGYSSAITLATSQAAAKHELPHVVDVGVSDEIVNRGLKNVFRLSPGYGATARVAIENLVKLNEAKGRPAKTVMIIHEESLFGTGTAKLLSEQLPQRGFEVLEVIKHPNPHRDFTNIVLQIKSKKPDLIIPANYYNEYVLFARTLRQQKVEARGIYSVLGGAASNVKFVREFPEAAEYIMDCNHWHNPKSEAALERQKKAEEKKLDYTYEVFCTYNAVALFADAVERAAKLDRGALNEALAASAWDKHGMPYGPTKFVNGQNAGASPANTQVQGKEIKVIYPAEFASAEPIFPIPA